MAPVNGLRSFPISSAFHFLTPDPALNKGRATLDINSVFLRQSTTWQQPSSEPAALYSDVLQS